MDDIDDTDYKKRVMEALRKHHEKNDAKYKPKRRIRRNRPEKIVEMDCMLWMRAQGWSVDVFEAKATFDPKSGSWRNQAMKAGVCDCLGSTNEGIAVAIEFKAPGARASFNRPQRASQREFILTKIASGNFAAVVDSLNMLKEVYENWRKLRYIDMNDAKKYLLDSLPEKRVCETDDDSLFGE